MKRLVLFLIFFFNILFCYTASASDILENIHWLGHDTFKFVGEKVIITDPFKLKKNDYADIILISHPHFDHCSPEDVKKLQSQDTIIVTTPDCASKLTGNIRIVKPGDKIKVKGVDIEVVPAYNVVKERLKFHPKANEWVGFVFTIKGNRIYFPGDTDFIPEMKDIKADIALLPVSGTYVMDVKNAVEAALAINPKLAIPMHYGKIVGTEKDAHLFKELLKGKVRVEILKEE
ncbi:MBL fold metallo-hydrolase [Thermodesulfovibrio hydrogeniphilus]